MGSEQPRFRPEALVEYCSTLAQSHSDFNRQCSSPEVERAVGEYTIGIFAAPLGDVIQEIQTPWALSEYFSFPNILFLLLFFLVLGIKPRPFHGLKLFSAIKLCVTVIC